MVVRVIQKSHRVAIPPEIWGGLGLREGDQVEVYREGNRVIIKPLPEIEDPTEMLWTLSKSPTPVDQPDVVIRGAMGEIVEREIGRKRREVRRLKRVHIRAR
ncbi:MAG: AbrB/MazE/SpoVT family DNA-binding domain-containing protein [Hadesarchaea archaeon]|nr:AbrB/MazE/SpoVT family DNA-binding domain-containing protein [Hadesarchaea archaeon]